MQMYASSIEVFQGQCYDVDFFDEQALETYSVFVMMYLVQLGQLPSQ